MKLNVITMNASNYCGRGAEYANNLARAVARNLDAPHRFTCFTDDATGLLPGIEARPLPHDGLIGWMNKVSLFKPGVFAEGERILWIDLDTLVINPIDDIASYDGEFAVLEDLLFPGQWGTGVMAWRGGFGGSIWQRYVEAVFPNVQGGDQFWLMHCAPRVDILQDLYPNQIASYKVHGGQLSAHTRICCFHGWPRPHEVTSGWVPSLWHGESAVSNDGEIRVIH